MQNDIIQQLQPNLREYIEGLGITIKGKSFPCPLHDDRRPSATIFNNDKNWKCYSCGERGDIVNLHQYIEGMELIDSILDLAKKYNIKIEENPSISTPKEKKDIAVEILTRTANILRENITESYIKERNISIQEAKQNYIGTISQRKLLEILRANKFEDKDLVTSGVCIMRDGSLSISPAFGDKKLTFTIRNASGNVIAFAGRDMFYNKDSKWPKYINTEQTAYYIKSKVLYNLHHAMIQSPRPTSINIVEGYTDVLSMKGIGFKNTVGVCGTALTQDHINLLKSLGIIRINICMDGDRAGIEHAYKYINKYFSKGDLKVVFTVLPDKHDPDSFIKEFGAEEFKNITPMSMAEFIIRYSPKLEGLTEDEKFISRCDAAIWYSKGDLISLRILTKVISSMSNMTELEVAKVIRKRAD